MAELELRDAQDQLQRESANTTSLTQGVQLLESELRSMTSKAEELEGSLAGSRSERERLSTSLKNTETGVSISLLDSVPFAPHDTDPLSSARQQLDGRLGDALATVSVLENRLGISQQELQEARSQASQHQQTISLLVSEKNALAASANRLAELEPRMRDRYARKIVISLSLF